MDIVLHGRGFERVIEDMLFNLMVCNGEAVMLPLMFGPGIHEKRL
jgi:hypothetical protein